MTRVTIPLKPLCLALLASFFAAGAANADSTLATPAVAIQDGQYAHLAQVHHRTSRRSLRRSDRRFLRGQRYLYSSRHGLRRGYGYRPNYHYYDYRPYSFRSRRFRYGYRY